MNDADFLNVRQAAARLDRDYDTGAGSYWKVWPRVRSGEIPVRRFAGRPLIAPSQIPEIAAKLGLSPRSTSSEAT